MQFSKLSVLDQAPDALVKEVTLEVADIIQKDKDIQKGDRKKVIALVEAKVGKGRWLYVGLGLWRQLPAGTDGAYRLMANLLSLP